MNGNIDFLEVYRKIFHILLGVFISAMIYLDALQIWMVLAILVVGLIISAAYIFYDLPLIKYFLNKFEREHLRKKFPGKGVIYLFLAVLFMMLIFDKNIVLAGMMIWTFGDSISALVGKHYGRITHPLNNTRLLEGTIAGIVIASATASLFVYWIYAIIASIIAMTIESIDFKFYKNTLDDNFLIPIIGAFAIYFLMML